MARRNSKARLVKLLLRFERLEETAKEIFADAQKYPLSNEQTYERLSKVHEQLCAVLLKDPIFRTYVPRLERALDDSLRTRNILPYHQALFDIHYLLAKATSREGISSDGITLVGWRSLQDVPPELRRLLDATKESRRVALSLGIGFRIFGIVNRERKGWTLRISVGGHEAHFSTVRYDGKQLSATVYDVYPDRCTAVARVLRDALGFKIVAESTLRAGVTIYRVDLSGGDVGNTHLLAKAFLFGAVPYPLFWKGGRPPEKGTPEFEKSVVLHYKLLMWYVKTNNPKVCWPLVLTEEVEEGQGTVRNPIVERIVATESVGELEKVLDGYIQKMVL